MFVDHVKLYIKAGDGGDGCVAFHREKYVAAGGPSGGDGGNGGNIIFRVDLGTNTLLAYRYRHKFVAANGQKGMGEKFHGATADDLIIPVPQGTLIIDEKTGKVIHDMSDGADYIACRGGRGGWGNRHFATPTRQLPTFAKGGTAGEERTVLLELKMIADVGLIGYPSVGKSSLLSRISAAKPKIAEYHFTTLEPNLGVVATGDEGKGFVAADIPGLIEGAADGAGLGLDFLRHVDRCRLLLHVVDISCFEGRNPVEDIKIINHELAHYSEALASRPQMIIANKTDMLDRETVDIDAFEAFVRENGWELLYVSAATGQGLQEMVRRVAERLQELPPIKVYECEITPQELAAERAKSDEVTIRRENDTFFVEGEWLRRLVQNINFSDYESINYFQKTLRREGIFEALEAKGCTDGHTVSIYDFEFDYLK